MANTADSTGRGHPISVVVSRFEDELKTLRDQPAWSMSADETREAMVKLARLEAQLALSELARRLENPRLLEDPPPYRQNAVLRGPRHLPIACDGIRP